MTLLLLYLEIAHMIYKKTVTSCCFTVSKEDNDFGKCLNWV